MVELDLDSESDTVNTKRLQSKKTLAPTSLTESGITKLSREVQFMKAPSQIRRTESGIVRFSKEMQFAKA